jgi:hypothetical protein
MPVKKRKSSLGRKTAGAKKVHQIRLNEDDQTYSQRLEVVKEKLAMKRKNETVQDKKIRLNKRRFKDNLKSKSILEEHQKVVKSASQSQSQVVSRTRGALKRKALNELYHPSKKLKEVITVTIGQI